MSFVSYYPKRLLLSVILLAGIEPAPVSADTIYLATGANGSAGTLHLINPDSGAPFQTIGPLIDASGNAYGISGMAFQPGTNVLYGSTTAASPTARGHLVRIDPATALVTDVGSFGFGPRVTTLADITFDPTSGILYGMRSGGPATAVDHWLYSVSLETGVATKVGTGSRTDSGGEGLAANSAGVLFATPDGNAADPTLRRVNKTTGDETVIALLNDGPTPRIINALAFNSSGILFGIETDQAPTTYTHLVKIDTSAGTVTDIGASVANADALAILTPGNTSGNDLLLNLLWFGST